MPVSTRFLLNWPLYVYNFVIKDMTTRSCFAFFAVAFASVLGACGGSGSVVPPPPPPPPPAPVISAVAPASVTLGVPLSIAHVLGANFGASAQVLIDGQPAVYTTFVNSGDLQITLADSVSATLGVHQVTVQQPSGTSNISPFTVYTPQPASPVMTALPAYLVGNENYPPSIAVADINGDGFADVLVPNWPNSQVAILDGNADGTLSAPQYISVLGTYAIAVGDVNGDGNPDLISVSDGATTTVSVLLGDGHGNFQPVSSQQTVNGAFPSVVGLTDMDGDGKPDLVLYVQSALVWLKNTGNGNFAAPVTLAPVVNNFVALADFNNDGKPDLLYPAFDESTGINTFHILLNKGKGKFTDQVAAGFNGICGIATVIDFNKDGTPDLVVQQAAGLPATYTLISFLGNGDGSFTQVASIPTPGNLQFVTGDFDDDGFPDLAGGGLLYLFGDGQGNFTPLQLAGPGANVVGVGDINGDGLPDVVAADISDFVAVALGQKGRNYPSPIGFLSGTWGDVKLGDITGNGLLDIFTGGVDDPIDNIYLPGSVFQNQGNGSFVFSANTSIDSFAIRDLTGKGVVDLIGSNGNSLYIWPNNGTLSFSPSPVTVQTTIATGFITVADMDGDGHPDIVTAGEILFGNGDYQFTPLPLAIGNAEFAVGHFAGTAQLDIVTGNTVLLNRGNRNFQSVPTNLPEGLSMAVGDFNGDGKDDLVLSDGSDVFVIYYSNGDGTFYQAAQLSLGGGAQAAAFEVGDFNGDGRPDLAISMYGTGEMAMFFGQPGGLFSLSYFVAGTDAYSMAFGDINHTGKLDLVMEPYPPENPPTLVQIVFHQ